MVYEQETFTYQRVQKVPSELNIWLCFPSPYSFGMSALGYLSIFKTLDLKPEYCVERIFTDTQKTQLMFNDVDLMGFSFSFEIDFLGVFQIMEKYKIPFKACDRDESYPLIYGGGPVLTSNPEPFAELFDFIMIGDAEEIDKNLMEVLKNNKHLPKKELLVVLSKIKGIYVPSLKDDDYFVEKETSKISKCIATPVLTEKSYFSNSYIIEVVRGCPQRCGFCMASYLNLPVRFADYNQIIENIEIGLRYTNKIALLGALIAAHPQFNDICEYIYNKVQNGANIELSVSSLRADSISSSVVKTLVACGQKHATIAIEAGSDRLRKLINKNLTEKQIFETVKTAYENGLKGLKIYAMIGLPTETQEDIDELVNLALKLKKMYKGFDFTFSFATFVPKAHTPFQFEKRDEKKVLEKKYDYLKKNFQKNGIKIRCSSVKWDEVQALFSMGGREMLDYAVEVYKKGVSLGNFKTVYKDMLKAKKLPPVENLLYKCNDENTVFPWDFIKICPSKNVLWQEHERLLNIN